MLGRVPKDAASCRLAVERRAVAGGERNSLFGVLRSLATPKPSLRLSFQRSGGSSPPNRLLRLCSLIRQAFAIPIVESNLRSSLETPQRAAALRFVSASSRGS